MLQGEEIEIGDRIPQAVFWRLSLTDAAGDSSVTDAMTVECISSVDVFDEARTVVVVGVVGAFAPVCTNVHLSGFVRRAAELQSHGVDVIACVAVNDPYVMAAWSRQLNAQENVLMLADDNAAFTRAIGMDIDETVNGTRMQSRRYALIVKNGIVKYVGVEEGSAAEGFAVDRSSVETICGKLGWIQ